MTKAALPICGIIMPISGIDAEYSEHHWQRVRAVLEKAIADAGMKPQPVWENQANDVIQARILKNVYENELVVCDVSSRNPNVMLELGMRLSTKKPAILVADDETSLPFDTSVIAHSFYQRDLEYNATAKFVCDLTATISAVRDSVASNEYVSFVENFRFETVAPSTVSVTAEQFYAERWDDMKAAMGRIEQELKRVAPAEFKVPVSVANMDGLHPNNVLSALAQHALDAEIDPRMTVGTRVFHAKFGSGTVIDVEGAKVTANFDRVGSKQVLHSFINVIDE